MPISQPTSVKATQFGSYYRVQWKHSIGVNTAPDGFKIYLGDSATPNWVSAIDNGLNDGDDASPTESYSVLVYKPGNFIVRWETFEEYNEGEITIPMNAGYAAKWDGPWSTNTSTIGYIGHGDNFESYSDDEISESMSAGTGWSSPWSTTTSSIGYIGHGDNFESYSDDEISESMSAGTGWSSPWSTAVSDVGYMGHGDDFELYSLGEIAGSSINGGSGWVGNSTISDRDYGQYIQYAGYENFESYDTGSITSAAGGVGFIGAGVIR